MLFAQVVETSAAVASTASRLGKVGHLADCLKRASDEDDAAAVATVVAFLSGDLTQRQIGVGWASLREMPSAATVPTLTVREVDETFGRVGALSGAGSQAERRAALAGLFSKATEREQRFLYGLLSGELRQGALDGVMTDAIAKAAAIPIAEVRRAVMLLARWVRCSKPRSRAARRPSPRSACRWVARSNRCWPRRRRVWTPLSPG